MTVPSAKVSAKNATIDTLTADMVRGGLSQLEAEQKAAQKARDSHTWLIWAGLFVALTLAVVGVALYVVVHLVITGGNFPVILAFVFGGAALVPLLVALFCATQASSEFISLYLGNLFRIGRAVRGKEDAP